ncbi:MAG: DUF2974 domain-containing protein [Candidatus Gracilibacteria bacterium]|nr:DUF2974 domain-containing protein [Candidatus Gracilibacteria bacterium]
MMEKECFLENDPQILKESNKEYVHIKIIYNKDIENDENGTELNISENNLNKFYNNDNTIDRENIISKTNLASFSYIEYGSQNYNIENNEEIEEPNDKILQYYENDKEKYEKLKKNIKLINSGSLIKKSSKEKIFELKENFNKEYNFIEEYKNENTGFYAIFVENKKTKEKIIAIRGTDEILKDSLNRNLSIFFGDSIPKQLADLILFIEKLKNDNTLKNTDKITLLGHSLGGNLSQLGGRIYDGFVKDIYNFNGPGTDGIKGSINLDGYSEKEKNIIIGVINKYNKKEQLEPVGGYNIISDEFISKFREHYGNTIEISSEFHGIDYIGKYIKEIPNDCFDKASETYFNELNKIRRNISDKKSNKNELKGYNNLQNNNINHVIGK